MEGESAIRFLLDGEVRTVRDISPTTTVLQYLREHLGRCGTKEGCAEGDCGACTVVLGELAAGSVRYRAINACIQFVPTLDGKALFTVESLKRVTRDGAPPELHPVQRAMVECHGSQCGFCTPGFVMSLYALYRNRRDPSDEDIRHAISGNLCRCTGYRPILAAARRMCELERADEHDPGEKLAAIRVTREKRLVSGSSSYLAPVSVEGLARALADKPRATILAGGTDVGLWVTKRYADLPDIVYVGNVAELRRIERAESHVQIGAAVSLTDAFGELLHEYPQLQEIARRFASPPICNAGTLAGNVANGSPIGDSMPALIVLGATVVLHSARGTRELPLEDFYLDYQKKDLRDGEFLFAVRVPRAHPRLLFRSYKVSKRFDQDISAVCAAFAVEIGHGRVRSARIGYGGMAAIPKRARACEQALVGAEWSRAAVSRAAQALARDFEPITDMRASSDYRLRVAANLLLRFQADVDSPAQPSSVWRYAG